MKLFYVLTFIVLIVAIIMSLGLNVRVPEPVQEKIVLRVMEGCLKGVGYIMGATVALGLTGANSPFLKEIGNNVYRVCTTGRLQMAQTQGLKISNQVMSGIPVRVYEPESSVQQPSRPVLLYLHGGGWAFLSIDNYDHLCQKLAKEANIVVISVDYRLSPQNPYPAGLDDVTSVVMHVSENGKSLGIDPGRIAVGGDSAGGNLAAAVQLRPETRGKIAMLLLLVPVLQGVNMKTIGFIENAEYLHNSINNPGQVVYFFHYMRLDHSLHDAFRNNLHTSVEFKKGKYRFLFDQEKYLPVEYIRSAKLKQRGGHVEQVGNETLFNELKDKLLTPTIFPLMASDDELSKFPFTYVIAAGYDLIRDDAIMFAERLRHLNVKVQLSHFPDGFHNDLIMFDGVFKTDVGIRTVNDMVKVLKKLKP